MLISWRKLGRAYHHRAPCKSPLPLRCGSNSPIHSGALWRILSKSAQFSQEKKFHRRLNVDLLAVMFYAYNTADLFGERTNNETPRLQKKRQRSHDVQTRKRRTISLSPPSRSEWETRRGCENRIVDFERNRRGFSLARRCKTQIEFCISLLDLNRVEHHTIRRSTISSPHFSDARKRCARSSPSHFRLSAQISQTARRFFCKTIPEIV